MPSKVSTLFLPVIRNAFYGVRTASSTSLKRIIGGSLTKKELLKAKQNPAAVEASRARKVAHAQRQLELREQREKDFGSSIHGIPTPFVESFDSAGQVGTTGDGKLLPTAPTLRNYFLSEAELEQGLEKCYTLTKPLAPTPDQHDEAHHAQEKYEKELEAHRARHEKAREALRRITDLENASAKDRRHANIRRCIEEFGRHRTDHTLKRPHPPPIPDANPPPKPPRAGPDTGSSEVQIAILTAKIRALAQQLDGHRGFKDKANKRGLRMMCHKRQRLLRYMERKERDSGRWKHMIETLGLTEATWKGQISF